MDKISREQRHKNMALIRGCDTKPELIVRSELWKRGFRYRKNQNKLPGHPDLVLRKYRTCIFVNGCFWHGHHVKYPYLINSKCCRIPQTNREYWVAKIKRNQQRDIEVQIKLSHMGWHCITVWECQLKPKILIKIIDSITYTLNKIWLNDHTIKK